MDKDTPKTLSCSPGSHLLVFACSRASRYYLALSLIQYGHLMWLFHASVARTLKGQIFPKWLHQQSSSSSFCKSRAKQVRLCHVNYIFFPTNIAQNVTCIHKSPIPSTFFHLINIHPHTYLGNPELMKVSYDCQASHICEPNCYPAHQCNIRLEKEG